MGAAVHFDYHGNNLVWSQAVLTDAQGYYVFEHIPAAGFYYSWTDPEREQGAKGLGGVVAEDLHIGSRLLCKKHNFSVQPGDRLVQDLTFEGSVTLAGKVVDVATGSPVPNMELRLLIETGQRYLDTQDVLADANGHFETAVAPGSKVRFSFEESRSKGSYLMDSQWRRQNGYNPEFRQAVTEDILDLKFKIKMIPVHPLTRRVVDANGTVIANAPIYMHADVPSAKTDESGVFTLKTAFSERAFDLYAESTDQKLAGIVHLPVGAKQAEIKVAPTKAFVGQVSNADGLPAGNLTFYLDLRLNDDNIYRVRREPTTDEAGAFTAANLCARATYYAWWSSDNDENRDYDYGNATIDLSMLDAQGQFQLPGVRTGSDGPEFFLFVGDNWFRRIPVTKPGNQEFEFILAPQVGDRVPDISMQDIATNQSVSLSSLRGGIVYLEFWATWCGPCKIPMVKLNHVARKRYKDWDGRVHILATSIDDSVEIIQHYVAQRGWNVVRHLWAGAESDNGFKSKVAQAFGLRGVPNGHFSQPVAKIVSNPIQIKILPKTGSSPERGIFFQSHLEYNKEIEIDLAPRGAKYLHTPTIRPRTIVFAKTQKDISATLKVTGRTSPKTKWETSLELLDYNGNVLATDQLVKQTSGVKTLDALLTKGASRKAFKQRFHFKGHGLIKATSFRITIAPDKRLGRHGEFDRRGDWGKPVAGSQCRIRSNKISPIHIESVIKNTGSYVFSINKTQERCELCVDGQWYRHKSINNNYVSFGPKNEYGNIAVTMDNNWYRKTDHQLLDLKPGKNTIQLAFAAKSNHKKPIPLVWFLSNEIEIEIPVHSD